jgi:hypothetical protein
MPLQEIGAASSAGIIQLSKIFDRRESSEDRWQLWQERPAG